MTTQLTEGSRMYYIDVSWLHTKKRYCEGKNDTFLEFKVFVTSEVCDLCRSFSSDDCINDDLDNNDPFDDDMIMITKLSLIATVLILVIVVVIMMLRTTKITLTIMMMIICDCDDNDDDPDDVMRTSSLALVTRVAWQALTRVFCIAQICARSAVQAWRLGARLHCMVRKQEAATQRRG